MISISFNIILNSISYIELIYSLIFNSPIFISFIYRIEFSFNNNIYLINVNPKLNISDNSGLNSPIPY